MTDLLKIQDSKTAYSITLPCPICKTKCRPTKITESYNLEYEDHTCKPNYQFKEFKRHFSISLMNNYISF